MLSDDPGRCIAALAQQAARGTLDPATALRAISQLTAGDAASLSLGELATTLSRFEDAELRGVARTIRRARLSHALLAHDAVRLGQKIGEQTRQFLSDLPASALVALGSREPWLSGPGLSVPAPSADPEREATRSGLDRELPQAVDDDAANRELVSMREQLFGGEGGEARFELLGRLAAWPTPAAAPTLAAALDDPDLAEKAELILTLRFGAAPSPHGEERAAWTAIVDEARRARWRQLLEHVEAAWSAELRRTTEIDSALAIPVAERETASTGEPSIGASESLPDEIEGEGSRAAPRRGLIDLIWRDHVQPLFAANWYLVVGIAMVIVGSSLLAYYTWDKFWLVRYTLMPALLAGFTVALGLAADWMERRDGRFRVMATWLRGAAVGLLPVNFMAVSLLAGDSGVTYDLLAVPIASGVYVALGYLGLRRWCRAVHPSLSPLLAVALLGINALVMIAPLATALSGIALRDLDLIVAIGFYVGFAGMAAAIVRFSLDTLTAELAREQIVPWFFGGTLLLTFVQVFGWVHASLGRLPQTATYAPLLVVAGGVVLLVERRSISLRDGATAHGAESFLGFAAILLGIFLGFRNEWIRIVVLALSGAIWLGVALSRGDRLQAWIATTWLLLSVAAIGILDAFPVAWRPVLGLILAALLVAAARATSRRRALSVLAECVAGQVIVVLVVSVIVAVLTQWEYDTPPLGTAICLAVVAAFFAFRSSVEKSGVWIHAAAIVAAIALPYLGFVDVSGRTLEGNTLVFGFAILSAAWLAITARSSFEPLRGARSSVLFAYGIFAASAMLLRIYSESGVPDDAGWPAVLNQTGPFVVAVSLAVAAFHSRSLLPSLLAAVILVIIFPELKAEFRETFETIGWGSGLGSASSAVVLVLVAFALRRASWLRGLEGGDPLIGSRAFPLRRQDHTLFTWPILASAVFLVAKTAIWTVPHQLAADGPFEKTALALGLSGVIWGLVGVYHRLHPLAVLTTHLAWISIAAAFATGELRLADDPHWASPTVATIATLAAVLAVSRIGLARRWPWTEDLFVRPLGKVLLMAAEPLACALVVDLLAVSSISRSGGLAAAVVPLLALRGLYSRSPRPAILLFVLGWATVLAASSPADRPILYGMDAETAVFASFCWLGSVLLVWTLLDRVPGLHGRTAPLIDPMALAASLATIILGFYLLHELVHGPPPTAWHWFLAAAVYVLAARVHASGPFLVFGAFCAHVGLHRVAIESGTPVPWGTFDVLTEPLRAAGFAAALTALYLAGRRVESIRPGLFTARSPLRVLASSPRVWMLGTIVVAASLAVLRHGVSESYRSEGSLLVVPFVCGFAVAVCGLAERVPWLGYLGAVFVAAGNVHVVRKFLGNPLIEKGLSEAHLVALGIGAVLLESSLTRRFFVRDSRSRRHLGWIEVSSAIGVFALLTVNYFASRDLESVTSLRFIVSSGISYLSALYLRRASLVHQSEGSPHAAWLALSYDFGVTLALWCAALAIPALRSPGAALWALTVPAFYFGARAVAGGAGTPLRTARYVASSGAIAFLVLFLWVFRSALQLVAFPEAEIEFVHYHVQSPIVLAISMLLFVLHGLGGTRWFLIYGGLSLVTGCYFLVSWIPGFSPFENAVSGAWVAIAVAHGSGVALLGSSPVASCIRTISKAGAEVWSEAVRSWTAVVAFLSHFAVAWGIADASAGASLEVAPLAFGVSTVSIHFAWLLRSRFLAFLGLLEVLSALHADFLVPSWLERDHVVWAVLAMWAAVLMIARRAPGIVPLSIVTPCGFLAAAISFVHVIRLDPGSIPGLWAAAVTCVLYIMIERCGRAPATRLELIAAFLPLAFPAWLAFFANRPPLEGNLANEWLILPTLAAAAALAATGCSVRWFWERLAERYLRTDRPRPVIADQLLSVLGSRGREVSIACFAVTTVIAWAATLSFSSYPLDSGTFSLLLLLHVVAAAAWIVEGRSGSSTIPFLLAEACALGVWLSAREEIRSTVGGWTSAHDVYASLVASAAFTGLHQYFAIDRRIRVPLAVTLVVVPIAAIAWIIIQELGTDLALLVLGVQSLQFTFLGKDRRDSPFNLFAVGGFVAFVVLGFWTKLELRFFQAYVIPVGLGVLALVQLFGARLRPEARNVVRTVTVLAMLGSAAWHALVDERFPVGHLVTFGVLSASAMVLGTVLRIRLYLVAGFFGLLVDLAAVLYKVLVHLERGPRMTIIGVLVLGAGALLVFGTIYARTHEEDIARRFLAWKHRFDPKE
jgi:hypothetical protein